MLTGIESLRRAISTLIGPVPPFYLFISYDRTAVVDKSGIRLYLQI